MRYASLFERLLANSVESETHSYNGTPCRCWTGATDRRGEYGRVNVRVGDRRCVTRAVHRVIAELILGRPLDPERETIQHGCDNPPCISWLHFEIATRVDNSRDSQNRRRGLPRQMFKPLVDPELFDVDPLMWCKPLPRAAGCPF